MARKRDRSKCEIDLAGTTSDTLASRGGLSPFVRYYRNIAVAPHLESHPSGIRGGFEKAARGRGAAY